MPIPIRSGRFIPTAVGNAALMTAYANSPSGSSPRLWGTRPQQHRRGDVGRFIPTAVGNAKMPRSCRSSEKVHPHGCGERLKPLPPFPATMRFIPTAVGNAMASNLPSQDSSVHPHGCGERYEVITMLHPEYGSSPRLWGTLRRAI